jgi:transketolase
MTAPSGNWKGTAVRTAFFETLGEIASRDPRIMLLVGDLGFGVVESFARRFPAQFVNVGVAEQNMTGLACGLALSGKTVFTYSIANFPTLRCLEQIRNDVCYHRASVVVVSVGGGLAYGSLGATHHATEDLAVMRAIPEMRVVAPGDPFEVREATAALIREPGPAYLRLGRVGEPILHGAATAFELGKAIVLRDGRDVTLISTGGTLKLALDAAETLAASGIQARVVSMHTLKPLDSACVLAAARETPAVVTIEEHSILGGLGSAVAEVLAESDLPKVRFRRLGLPPEFLSLAGTQEYLCTRAGLSTDGICAAVKALVPAPANLGGTS